MPGLSHIPSWTSLSYSCFTKYQPVIKRWVKQSKSKIKHTERSIRNLFLKIFYISASESLLNPEYSTFLNPEFLRKYNLKKSQFPHTITKFLDLFDISQTYMADTQVLNFYLMMIHRVFKWVTEKLSVGIKSELKTLFTSPFIKLYELKMLVNITYSDFSEITEPNFRFGGIAALFTEYLTELCLSETKPTKRKHLSRKLSGSIFTPLWIIRLIRERLYTYLGNNEFKHPIQIADISVGYGGFLDCFLTKSERENNQNSINLHGFDADPHKIDVLKLNHAILHDNRFSSVNISNFKLQDSLTQPSLQKFDILVGNPPWGAVMNKSKLLKIEDLSQFTVKQYDSYGLFLIRNVLSLNENGLVYLVLPETILLNQNYKELRKYLLDNTTILDIIHLGENIFDGVNMPAIILGVKKKKASPTHSVNIFLNINTESDLKENPISNRPQKEFLENDGFVFDIFTNNEDRAIIERIDKVSCYTLHDLVDNSRGVEIGKKGEVLQCYHCKVWMPVPVWSLDHQTGAKYANCSVCKQKMFLRRLKNRDRIIIDQVPDGEVDFPYSRFLIGENIHKYVFTGSKFIILQRRGIKYKTAKIYKQNKILIRKTSRELLASIDYDDSYTIQVVYQFSLKDDFKSSPYLLEFILGIISSHILQFYYAKKFQYANRKSFPHHTQKNILSLPIPDIEFSTKNAKYSEFYAKIVFSSLTLMHLSHFKEFQTTHKLVSKKLTDFIEENPKILENIELPKECNDLLLLTSNLVGDSPPKLEIIQDIIDSFQKILDNTVERLFLALE